MCGLAGYLYIPGHAQQAAEEIATAMAQKLVHRGPDDCGVWTDADAGVALAHRRLSILDLSHLGHQPMASPSGRYSIVFNGEIYNHSELRTQLAQTRKLNTSSAVVTRSGAPFWRGHSDTETLLAGIEEWGLEITLKKAIGMFAIALWDRKTRTLILARDRLGEKPLYYGWQGSGNERVFLFGSELKALKAHPAFVAQVDRGALCLFLKHNYVPAPLSIYQGVAKLEPGCLLTVSLAQPEPRIQKYWDAAKVARAGLEHPFVGTADQAVDALEVLAKDVVRQQMVSDVPLGAFLSGGIDSSTVVALMQSQSTNRVKTFTIGFNEEGYNEAVHARAVAHHLGTDHSELYVTPRQAMEVIPLLPDLYCEPFADSSQIPTFLVSQLAKSNISVSLSGDAGDELFCGYNRYQLTNAMWRKLALLPVPVRYWASEIIKGISPSALDRFLKIFPGSGRYAFLGQKLHKAADVVTSTTVDELYRGLVSHVQYPEDWVVGGFEPPTHLTGLKPDLSGFNTVERMMLLDSVSYLPDDILVKVDRAGMGVSLESRAPFLDHRLFEFAWSLPLEIKLRAGQTKWPLRQILYRYVPQELVDRPKMGFGVPLHDWLRGPLRDWAEDLLDDSRLQREGFFHPEPIRHIWEEHLTGRRNWMAQLWNVLMFQSWHQTNMV